MRRKVREAAKKLEQFVPRFGVDHRSDLTAEVLWKNGEFLGICAAEARGRSETVVIRLGLEPQLGEVLWLTT